MAYNPKTWATGETITAAELNAIEQGLAGVGGGPAGSIPVYATTDQAVADAHPEYAWIVLGTPASGGDTTAPSTPTGLTATAGNAQVVLAWTASTDNVAVTGYRVYRGGTLVASPTGTSYTDTGLTNGTAYSYTVAAADAAGNLSAQTSAASATPTAPVATPTLVGKATTTAAAGSTRTINLPTGIQAGDRLVLLLGGNLDPVFTMTPPSGWTQRATTANQDAQIWTATATGSEGATITWGTQNAGEQMGFCVYALRGVAETPIALGSADSFANHMDLPTLTGVPSNGVALTICTNSADAVAGDTYTTPTGWTSDGVLTYTRVTGFAHNTGFTAGTWTLNATASGKLRVIAAAFS